VFPANNVCKLIDSGNFTLKHYHDILLMIFHQTFTTPAMLALAAAHCPPKYYKARDYLIKHAEEEKMHWTWVLNDLSTTGYNGPDPRQLFPKPACQAYIAFN